MRVDRILKPASIAWITLVWVGGVGVPLAALLGRVRSLGSLLDPVIVHVAGITAGQALVSATLAAVVGLPLGLWVGSRQGSGVRGWAGIFLALPFGVPTVVAGLAWVLLLGRSGVLARLGLSLDWSYSFKAVVAAQVAFNVPWIALWVAQTRLFVPERELDAARLLGAGGVTRFRWVVWPRIQWAFWSAACQSLVFCAMSFALILVLGGGPPVETLETTLFAKIRYGSLDLSGAVCCAAWELLITLVPWVLLIFFQSRAEIPGGNPARAAGAERGGRVSALGAAAVAALFFLPYLAVFRGFKLPGAQAWDEILPAARLSAELAASCGLCALGTAVAAVVAIESISSGKSPGSPGLKMLAAALIGAPAGISSLVLGLGLWIAYGRWIDPFSGSLGAIVALQTVIFFPIAFKILWPVAKERRVRQLEAAASLGASRFRAFLTVEWPRWKLPLASAFGMVAGASLGELGAVSLFYSENLIPLPLLISRWGAQYRFDDAQAVAVLLLILCSVTIMISAGGARETRAHS